MKDPGELTRILQAAVRNNPDAAAELLPLVYDELRRLAAARMKREPNQTLQPTALVHEVWMKLDGADKRNWNGRGHFFGAAAEAMRRILIDRARRRHTRAKAGYAEPEPNWESKLIANAPTEEMLAVHEALDQLTEKEPDAAEIVKLRYFVGMTMEQAALSLEMPLRRAERLWAFARAWLRNAMGAKK